MNSSSENGLKKSYLTCSFQVAMEFAANTGSPKLTATTWMISPLHMIDLTLILVEQQAQFQHVKRNKIANETNVKTIQKQFLASSRLDLEIIAAVMIPVVIIADA